MTHPITIGAATPIIREKVTQDVGVTLRAGLLPYGPSRAVSAVPASIPDA